MNNLVKECNKFNNIHVSFYIKQISPLIILLIEYYPIKTCHVPYF